MVAKSGNPDTHNSQWLSVTPQTPNCVLPPPDSGAAVLPNHPAFVFALAGLLLRSLVPCSWSGCPFLQLLWCTLPPLAPVSAVTQLCCILLFPITL